MVTKENPRRGIRAHLQPPLWVHTLNSGPLWPWEMVRTVWTARFKTQDSLFCALTSVLYTSAHREEGPEYVIASQTLPSATSKKSMLGSYFSKQLVLKHVTEKYNRQSNWKVKLRQNTEVKKGLRHCRFLVKINFLVVNVPFQFVLGQEVINTIKRVNRKVWSGEFLLWRSGNEPD